MEIDIGASNVVSVIYAKRALVSSVQSCTIKTSIYNACVDSRVHQSHAFVLREAVDGPWIPAPRSIRQVISHWT